MLTLAGKNAPGLLTPLMLFTTKSTSLDHFDNITLLSYLSLFSYASTIAAIVTSIPAVTSGLAEGYAMISAQGLDFSNPKIKTTVLHAAINDVAIAGAVYNWYSRSTVDGYMINGINTAISAIMLGSVLYSATLGGSLVYKYGVAVQRQGEGKKIKEETMAKTKEQGKKEL